MLKIIQTMALWGIDVFPVEVQVDVRNGLPGFSLVGLPDSSIREARDRVGAALSNSGYDLPPRKYTINLAPADRKKEGSSFDLPIAFGILATIENINVSENFIFVGELGLDAQVRKVSGIIAMAQKVKEMGKVLVFPNTQVQEIAKVKDLLSLSVTCVKDLLTITQKKPKYRFKNSPQEFDFPIKFEDIIGLDHIKRGLEIAALGRHSVLLYGSPGTGKSMSAKALASILLPNSPKKQDEIQNIYSSIGQEKSLNEIPFRSPHHSSSTAAILGGGIPLKPGEISLAHGGVLFLDELPEFSRQILEGLREPMEEGSISISRAQEKQNFPADFMLIAALNPCPCGYHGTSKCKCNQYQITRYLSKISGPILDRFDMALSFYPSDANLLTLKGKNVKSTSKFIRDKLLKCKQKEGKNLQDYLDEIKQNPSCAMAFTEIQNQEEYSKRAQYKHLNVAHTIAMLENRKLQAIDLWETLEYRQFTFLK